MPTLLVVDDDERVRKIAITILKQKGYTIISAASGLEALMVYSSYRSNLDLILTDVDMPQMNGIELADRIRSRDPAKRILLMSGRMSEGPTAYPIVSKPFLADQLLAAVETVLSTV
jgi:CheY-like chemotaxis protein